MWWSQLLKHAITCNTEYEFLLEPMSDHSEMNKDGVKTNIESRRNTSTVHTLTRCTEETRHRIVIIKAFIALCNLLKLKPSWFQRELMSFYLATENEQERQKYLVRCIGKQIVHCEPTQLQEMLCCVIRFVQLWEEKSFIEYITVKAFFSSC